MRRGRPSVNLFARRTRQFFIGIVRNIFFLFPSSGGAWGWRAYAFATRTRHPTRSSLIREWCHWPPQQGRVGFTPGGLQRPFIPPNHNVFTIGFHTLCLTQIPLGAFASVSSRTHCKHKPEWSCQCWTLNTFFPHPLQLVMRPQFSEPVTAKLGPFSSAKSDGVCRLLRCDSFAQVIFCTRSIEDRPHLL